MKNLEDFITLYEDYNKEDENPIQNQYNNAFFLREVYKCLTYEKNKIRERDRKGKIFSYFQEIILYRITNTKEEPEKNIKEVLSYLNEFVNAKSYYEKFESYNKLREILNKYNHDVASLDLIENEIDNLIYDIELENNENILDYNYIEPKLNEIVRQIANKEWSIWK